MIPYFSQPSLDLGFFTIHAFGVLVALAVFVGHRVFIRRLPRYGLDVRLGDRLLTWILVGGFVGAHLFDRLAYFPAETLEDPWSIVRFWDGLSSFGGFLGAIAGAWLFTRKVSLGQATWGYLDAVAYAFPFGWIFGRTGCFLAFDHPGLPTTFWLAQTDAHGVLRHNLGLDEGLFTVGVAALFALLGRRQYRPGLYLGLLPLIYGPFRFALDFLRSRDVRYIGLTPGQYGSALLFVIGIIVLGLRAQRVERDLGSP